jgi:uncharacterized protein
MNDLYVSYITERLSLNKWQVENCISLLEEGATIPFISRYRKERTGALDEVQVADVKHFYTFFCDLDKRKKTILDSIAGQEKLSSELEDEILSCVDLNKLEDLYLPFKPKRRTRASIAREKGLEPLAHKIFGMKLQDCIAYSKSFLTDSVRDENEALQGARDIIAEEISENIAVREDLRNQYTRYAKIVTRKSRSLGDEESEVSKFSNYFDFAGSLNNIPSHRMLAILRAEKEGHIYLRLDIEESFHIKTISGHIYKGSETTPSCREQIDAAIADSYKRLLHPSISNEVLRMSKEKADREAVRVFGDNLSSLLLAAPVGQKRVLAIDPGFRTGCKVVCLDSQGELLHNDTIYPHPPVNEKIKSIKKISYLVEAYKVEVIAIGDGTASRETEHFIKKIPMPKDISVYSVSEDGASVYSASAVAREEFPDYDVTVRGAVSIGRRVMDPLAELVKIDPKSMGVGQYQHDVDQSLLKEMLDNTVVNCVSKVGVNLNTASRHLLSYVSGLGPSVAKKIVEHRAQNGPFSAKNELLNVSRLGAKMFEQSAGFLRIPGGENPLDNTAVHPERYSLVEKIAEDLGKDVKDLVGDKNINIDLDRYISKDVGLLTLKDIVEELSRPGLDPRKAARVMEFSPDIFTIDDLKPGMVLPGIVTNITNFGVFVDVGIKQDGLVHISQMADKFVSNPSDIVKLHEHVRVKVLEVDPVRKRIQLSLKGIS